MPRQVFAAAAEPQAERPEGPEAAGRLIRVPLPITDTVGRTVERLIGGAVTEFRSEKLLGGATRPILILELDPVSGAGQGSKFPEALSIAEQLTSQQLAGVKTVAYIPRPIKGHGVLVAMACEEIVMAPDAEIGEAGVDVAEEASIKPLVREGYRRFADLRRTIPSAVALGMLDRNLEVVKVETEVSLEFVLSEDLDQIRGKRAIQSQQVLIRRGDLGRFTGREARELGFAKYLATDREALARALDLPPEAVEEDPLLGRPLEPRQINIDGPVSPQLVSRLQSMIDDQLRSGVVNLLCVRIDSGGGSLAESITLANYLAGLNRLAVRTVAYVPSQARADAGLIAAACDHLIMHPGAVLGGQSPRPITQEEARAARQSLSDLVRTASGHKSWSLLAALIDPELPVYQYRHRETGEIRYLSAEEADQLPDAPQWVRGQKVTRTGQPLELTGKEAKQYGLAWELVESFDELKDLYGMKGNPRLVEPNWADFLIEALASPGMAMLLLVIGGAALYAELQAPGIGVGGFLAAVAFMLFFWSKFLHGTSTWLEVTLFLGGVCFLLLEIFVLPGFGIFGLGGGMMIITSLVLASQTFVIPRTTEQLVQLRNSMLVVAGAGMGIVGATALMRRYLPRAPVLNRLMLNPVQGQELSELTERESMVNFGHLIGSRGRAVTQLTPSGKARFGNDLLDVIAEGEVIDRGRELVVVEVRGNRILVRAL